MLRRAMRAERAKRAVITGIGVISPNGIGKDEFWRSIRSGESGISELTRIDTAQYETKIGGEVRDFDPARFMDRKTAKMLSRFAQFALAAARMALGDARLDLDHVDPYRAGIAVGNAVGGKEVEEEQQRIFREKGCNTVNPFTAALISNNYAAGVIAKEFGIKGPNATFSTGCSSALAAIAHAFDLIREERTEVVLTGGSETPLVPSVFEAFYVSGSLTRKKGKPEKLSRPFDKQRDGYVLSEACGILVVEELEHARGRGAEIYAEIVSYGITNDGYSLFRMEPTGREAAKAIEFALENGDVDRADVNYINAHGSSSPLTDKRETQAIKSVFGEEAYRIPISSIKSMIGQPLGATGSLQVAATALAIKNRCITPTINYEEQDPECDLDYTPNRARPYDIRAALINSFGLGGNNTSLVLKPFAPAGVPGF